MIRDMPFFDQYHEAAMSRAAVRAQDKVVEISQRIDNLNRRAAVLKEIAVEVFEDCLKQAERL
jgi:hypothetical protein